MKPLSGIKTGLNEAFLIDTETKECLIRDDPKSAAILKPYLRGQDIKRWSPEWAGLWMIALKSSGDYPWPWANAGEQAEAVFRETYPSLYKQLAARKPALLARQDQGRYWWEMRSCAYWEQFEPMKILLPEMTWHLQWCLCPNSYICNNTAYILNSVDPWILSTMNSTLIWCYSWRNAVHGKDEVLRFIRDFVEVLPIPKPHDKTRAEVAKKVKKLCSITSSNLQSQTILLDWLKIQFDIAEPNTKLQNPIALTSDTFVSEVSKARGKKALTSAGLKALREEFATTIDPAKVLATEASGLELRIHDLVNEAYGLTPDEVRLMWDTAPPRMPIPRPPGV